MSECLASSFIQNRTSSHPPRSRGFSLIFPLFPVLLRRCARRDSPPAIPHAFPARRESDADANESQTGSRSRHSTRQSDIGLVSDLSRPLIAALWSGREAIFFLSFSVFLAFLGQPILVSLAALLASSEKGRFFAPGQVEAQSNLAPDARLRTGGERCFALDGFSLSQSSVTYLRCRQPYPAASAALTSI
jgi:hypothetical protein